MADEPDNAPPITDGEIEAVVARYREAMPRYEDAAALIESRLRRELRAAAIKCLLSSRAKHPDEIGAKLKRLRAAGDARASFAEVTKNINHVLTDLAGARVITYHPDDEYSVYQLVQRKLAVAQLPNASEHKRSDYRASHVLIEVDRAFERASLLGTVVEVQISSLASHAFNELEHDIRYKSHGVAATAPVDDCLADLKHASRLLDRVVERLLNERHASLQDAQTLLLEPEALRHSLERLAGRPLGGDFARLFRLLNPVLAQLTPANLRDLGDIDTILQAGRTRAGGVTDDDVIAFVLGLLDEFGPEFRNLALTWRGPTTDLKRAILENTDNAG